MTLRLHGSCPRDAGVGDGIMSKEILMVVDAVSNEKGVEKSVIFEAIEAALASATRKRYGDDIEVRVAIDRATGDYDTFRRWKVFADDSTELEEPARELRLEDAHDIDPDAEIGGYVEEPMESVEFGRIAAQTAKQVIVQKVREAEREQVVEEYQDRVGELLSGIVKRVDRNGAYVWRIATGNKAERVGVTIQRRENNMVSVEGKIAAGDKVVIEGHDNVRPGATVTLVKND